MIRYRTRDVTGLNNEPCICGRAHVRIIRVTRRRRRHVDYPRRQRFSVAGGGGSGRLCRLGAALSDRAHARGDADVMTVEIETARDANIAAGDRDGMAK